MQGCSLCRTTIDQVVDITDELLPNGEAQMCAWCGNNRANVVFMPCGCVRYCTVCTATLAPGKCPTHGINNAGRVKLFFGSNEPS